MKTSNIEVTYIGGFGNDLSVVNAARVSMDKVSTDLVEGDAKLIRYLATHKHTSPFNHAFLSFRIKAPIYAARQLVKHKFMPWNEISRRYVDNEPEFYFPEFYRKRAENVKQGSSNEDSGYDMFEAKKYTAMCLEQYNLRLAAGVSPEQARDCLPLNTHTEWIWSGTLGAFLDMLKLRLDPHAQYESRIVANAIAEVVAQQFPISYQEVINAG